MRGDVCICRLSETNYSSAVQCSTLLMSDVKCGIYDVAMMMMPISLMKYAVWYGIVEGLFVGQVGEYDSRRVIRRLCW